MALAQMFTYEVCENSNDTFFTEYLLATASFYGTPYTAQNIQEYWISLTLILPYKDRIVDVGQLKLCILRDLTQC